jgi:hypothetical protein
MEAGANTRDTKGAEKESRRDERFRFSGENSDVVAIAGAQGVRCPPDFPAKIKIPAALAKPSVGMVLG